MGRLGLGIARRRRGAVAGPSYSAAALAYFAAMSVTPDVTRRGLLDALIVGLAGDGVLAKLDWLSIMAAHDAQAARLDVVDPARSLAVIGTPSFTSDRGYQGAAASALNSGWDPPTNGVNYQQNNASAGAYVLNNAAGGQIVLGNQQVSLTPRNPGGNIVARCNAASTSTAAAPGATSIGLTAMDRSGPSSGRIYRNGSEVGANAIASSSVALTTEDFFVLAFNSGGAAGSPDTARRIAAIFWGGHLTATEHLALYNRLHTYLQAVGAV